MRYTPHPYQAYATQKIIDTPACGLFLEMGLGKTVATLTAVDRLLYDYFDVERPLVIAPLRVASVTWPAEVAKWEHLRHLKISSILGPPARRLSALKADADLWVINRENVKWLVELYGPTWPFDMIVVDELSSFKSPSSQRFKALRKVRPLARRFVGLTGTPTPKGLIDLWSQVYLMDRGERLGPTVTEYRHTYFTPGRRDGYVVFDWIPRPFAEQQIYEAIDDICVSMKNEDWLSLPKRIDQTIKVELPPAVREQYRKMERDYLLSVAEGTDVVASSAGVLTNKLLQLANGAVYDEDGQVHHLHDVKLDALEDLVESANGRPMLVVYAYRHDLDRLKERFPDIRELKTAKDVTDWNRGDIPLMVIHPASAGHGLNLQDGGSVLVWFGLTWSLELYQQTVARLHRQGQKHAVRNYHIVATGTMDVDVLKALTTKANTQEALMQAIKARMEEVLSR